MAKSWQNLVKIMAKSSAIHVKIHTQNLALTGNATPASTAPPLDNSRHKKKKKHAMGVWVPGTLLI